MTRCAGLVLLRADSRGALRVLLTLHGVGVTWAQSTVASDISVAAGYYPSEVGWHFDCTDGMSLSGGAPYDATSVAVLDGASCDLVMTDTFGDGWNGAEWQGFGQTITLSSGLSGLQSFTVLDSSTPAPPRRWCRGRRRREHGDGSSTFASRAGRLRSLRQNCMKTKSNPMHWPARIHFIVKNLDGLLWHFP